LEEGVISAHPACGRHFILYTLYSAQPACGRHSPALVPSAQMVLEVDFEDICNPVTDPVAIPAPSLPPPSSPPPSIPSPPSPPAPASPPSPPPSPAAPPGQPSPPLPPPKPPLPPPMPSPPSSTSGSGDDDDSPLPMAAARSELPSVTARSGLYGPLGPAETIPGGEPAVGWRQLAPQLAAAAFLAAAVAAALTTTALVRAARERSSHIILVEEGYTAKAGAPHARHFTYMGAQPPSGSPPSSPARPLSPALTSSLPASPLPMPNSSVRHCVCDRTRT